MKQAQLPVLISLAASLCLLPQAWANPTVSVGVAAPLTGESAVFGEDIKNVLLFARNHFGDTSIQLDIQDDQCSGKGGAATSRYFVQQEVRAVLGFACVESIMPAIPILQKAGIPVVSVLASGREITGVGRNVFNLYPSDDVGVKLIAQRLSRLKVTSILVLAADSVFPLGITDAFKRLPQDPGVDVTYKTYPTMTNDFASILLRFNSGRKAQAVFINYSSTSELIAFLKERERLKLNQMVFTSYLNGYDAIKSSGNARLIEGIEFYDTAPLEHSLQEKDKSVFENYLRLKGHLKSSDGYFPFIFNAYVALRSALSNASGIAVGLSTQRFDGGVGAPFSFHLDGTVQGGIPFVLRRIRNGAPETVVDE
jgi:ABC-type branched-subunit amino acid transport system substrate-binding protein